jgi:hypothetical protein
MFSGKRFAVLLSLAAAGITGSPVELEFTSTSVKDSPDLAREYFSRKAGHFAYWETRSD